MVNISNERDLDIKRGTDQDCKTQELAYYPGCSLKSTAIDFDCSIKKLFQKLEIPLTEIEDWNCCGTTPASNISNEIPISLASRNLFLAHNQGFHEILAPCVSCYGKLYKASMILNNEKAAKSDKDQKKREEIINSFKNMEVTADEWLDFRVYSIVEILLKNRDRIRAKYQENKNSIGPLEKSILDNLKPVSYYGCVLLRSDNVSKFDSSENPTAMEKILESIGVKSLDFSFKTECCGAILSLTYKNIVLKLSKKIIEAALEAGANGIIVCCPLCQQNLDMRQQQINRYYKTDYRMPVYYISQILGLGMGLSYKELMLDRLFVRPRILKNK